MYLNTALAIALAATGLIPASSAETLKQVWARLAPQQFSYLAVDPKNSAWFDNPSNLTVFVSEDSAYTRFFMDPASAALQDPVIVQASFSYLQVPGIYNSTALLGKDLILPTNLTDPSFTNVSGGAALMEITKIGKSFQIFTGNPFPNNIVSQDNYFDGGVLHVVDYIVPAPQNISYSGFFRNVSSLITFGELKPELFTTSDLTIFAPSNEALATLGRPLTLDDVNRHCVPNNATYTPLIGTGVTVDSFAGSPITLAPAGNGDFIVNGNTSLTTGSNYTVDNFILNGVVHVIDGIL